MSMYIMNAVHHDFPIGAQQRNCTGHWTFLSPGVDPQFHLVHAMQPLNPQGFVGMTEDIEGKRKKQPAEECSRSNLFQRVCPAICS